MDKNFSYINIFKYLLIKLLMKQWIKPIEIQVKIIYVRNIHISTFEAVLVLFRALLRLRFPGRMKIRCFSNSCVYKVQKKVQLFQLKLMEKTFSLVNYHSMIVNLIWGLKEVLS